MATFSNDKRIFLFLVLAGLIRPAAAATISGGKLVEDFTSLSSADLSAYTGSNAGLWNIVDHVAQAGAVSAGDSARPIWFGDGSDGALSLTSGSYTFDTDSHPQGYNFTSVNIGAGVTLNVQGSHPLIIRSLSTATIGPTLTADGGSAANGVANGATSAPSGGLGYACAGSGGAGGSLLPAVTANDGVSGFQSDGVTAEIDQGSTASPDATSPLSGPGPAGNFDSGAFFCGTGGGGGASRVDAGPIYGSGGGGGAGGGAVRIVSVGNLSVASVSANGGNGGNGADDNGGAPAQCSGNGSGGGGGAIWLQSFKTVSVTGSLSVNKGTGGSCSTAGADGFDGFARCDDINPSGRPACDTVGSQDQDTHLAASGSVTYYVQSKPYDLGTYNAKFAMPVVSSVPGTGAVQVQYAASSDGANFTSFTSDLTSLSGQNYRYVKFRITLMTGAAASAPPQVSRIEIPFEDLGPSTVPLTLGCGTTTKSSGKPPRGGGPIALFWGAVLLLEYFWIRKKWGSRVKDLSSQHA